ncbi:c-type cytochrome [Antarctobacter sp.]|uniref:c-type cytochrome n=1 Tax=Antarctobacter sp. TaxID=1872577 RepID=UPI003A8F8477
MKPGYIVAGALALGAAIAAYQFTTFGSADAQTAPAAGAALVQVVVPETLSPVAQIGKTGFDAICAACHGQNAAGRNGMGPPLIHKIYEPSHHGDESFQLAVQRGVRAHHWTFGNMPPVEGLTRADVVAIVGYVREMQRANGIN